MYLIWPLYWQAAPGDYLATLCAIDADSSASCILRATYGILFEHSQFCLPILAGEYQPHPSSCFMQHDTKFSSGLSNPVNAEFIAFVGGN